MHGRGTYAVNTLLFCFTFNYSKQVCFYELLLIIHNLLQCSRTSILTKEVLFVF